MIPSFSLAVFVPFRSNNRNHYFISNVASYLFCVRLHLLPGLEICFFYSLRTSASKYETKTGLKRKTMFRYHTIQQQQSKTTMMTKSIKADT